MMASNEANAAKSIKNELKMVFPGVKFSVTSDSFSMGNSVNISWTDGPTTEVVDKIVKKYQYGHFNGMEDIYEFSNMIKELPQAKFVMTNRHMSDETEEKIREELKIAKEDMARYNESRQEWNNTLVYRKFIKMDLRI